MVVNFHGVLQQSQGREAPEPSGQVLGRRRRPRDRQAEPQRRVEEGQVDGGARGEQEPGDTPEELPRPLPDGNGSAVPAWHDGDQGRPGRHGPKRRRIQLEVRVGADTRRVSGEAEELVQQVPPGKRRDAAVAEFRHPRRSPHLLHAELDPLGRPRG